MKPVQLFGSNLPKRPAWSALHDADVSEIIARCLSKQGSNDFIAPDVPSQLKISNAPDRPSHDRITPACSQTGRDIETLRDDMSKRVEAAVGGMKADAGERQTALLQKIEEQAGVGTAQSSRCNHRIDISS